jgi:hypothetical protein
MSVEWLDSSAVCQYWYFESSALNWDITWRRALLCSPNEGGACRIVTAAGRSRAMRLQARWTMFHGVLGSAHSSQSSVSVPGAVLRSRFLNTWMTVST